MCLPNNYTRAIVLTVNKMTRCLLSLTSVVHLVSVVMTNKTAVKTRITTISIQFNLTHITVLRKIFIIQPMIIICICKLLSKKRNEMWKTRKNIDEVTTEMTSPSPEYTDLQSTRGEPTLSTSRGLVRPSDESWKSNVTPWRTLWHSVGARALPLSWKSPEGVGVSRPCEPSVSLGEDVSPSADLSGSPICDLFNQYRHCTYRFEQECHQLRSRCTWNIWWQSRYFYMQI